VSSFIKELPADLVEHHDVSQILNAPVEETTVKSRFDKMLSFLDNVPD
jgi:hypothetical protein